MKRTIIEGNTVTTYEDMFPNRTYEIVDSIPRGFQVWHVGDHGPDGFVPICKLSDWNVYKVDPDSLKAVPFEHWREVMRVAAVACTIEKAEGIISGFGVTHHDEWAYNRVMEGIEFMRELPWD